MSLVLPESFHYGHFGFPWGGLIEPKLYRRRKWLLTFPVTYGPVPVITVGTSDDTSVIVSQGTSSIASIGSDATSVQVFTSGTSVFQDICIPRFSPLFSSTHVYFSNENVTFSGGRPFVYPTKVVVSQSTVSSHTSTSSVDSVTVAARGSLAYTPIPCSSSRPRVSIGSNTVQIGRTQSSVSVGVGQSQRPATNVSFVVAQPPTVSYLFSSRNVYFRDTTTQFNRVD